MNNLHGFYRLIALFLAAQHRSLKRSNCQQLASREGRHSPPESAKHQLLTDYFREHSMDFQLTRNLSAINRAQQLATDTLLYLGECADCLNREVILPMGARMRQNNYWMRRESTFCKYKQFSTNTTKLWKGGFEPHKLLTCWSARGGEHQRLVRAHQNQQKSHNKMRMGILMLLRKECLMMDTLMMAPL